MSTAGPITITAGRLLLPGKAPSPGGIRFENGLIVALGEVTPGLQDRVIPAGGALIAPGLIDLGVHAIDKPAFHFGGITRAALMPDLTRRSTIRRGCGSRRSRASPTCGCIRSPPRRAGLQGTELAEIALMREAGAKAVSTGRRWIADSGSMLRVLQYAAMLGLVVVSHAEDGGLVGGAVATAGEIATRLGLPAAPAEAEALAVARDIALAELAGARLHLRQVTTAAGLALVRPPRRAGSR